MFKPITPEDHGADPTGKLCSAVAIRTAAAQCRAEGRTLESYHGTQYRIDTPVDLRHISLSFEGRINPTFHEEPQVIIGGSSQDGQFNPNQFLWAVISPVASPLAPSIRVIGAKGQNIRIGRAQYLQLWADTDVDALRDSSIAYSRFALRHIDFIELQSNKATKGSLNQWINENKFSLGRCKTFIIDGTYTHNNNIIKGGAFENPGSVISIIRGSNNYFKDIRFENGGQVSFGKEARDNDIEYTWTSINPTCPDTLIAQDLGVRNTVHNSKTAPTTTATLLSLTRDSIRSGYARPSGVSDSVAETDGRIIVPAWRRVFLSGLLPFTSNTRISVKAEGNPIGGIRCALIGYDDNGVEITASTESDYESIGDGVGSFNVTQKNLPSSNTITGVTIIPQPPGLVKAKFVRLSVVAGGTGLECTHLSVSVDSDSAWGTNRQVGACAPVVQRGPEILLPLRVRVALPHITIAAHGTYSTAVAVPGVLKSSPLVCSFGGEIGIPPVLLVKATCTDDNVVAIDITNTSSNTVTLPFGAYAHMLAPGSTQPLKSI